MARFFLLAIALFAGRLAPSNGFALPEDIEGRARDAEAHGLRGGPLAKLLGRLTPNRHRRVQAAAPAPSYSPTQLTDSPTSGSYAPTSSCGGPPGLLPLLGITPAAAAGTFTVLVDAAAILAGTDRCDASLVSLQDGLGNVVLDGPICTQCDYTPSYAPSMMTDAPTMVSYAPTAGARRLADIDVPPAAAEARRRLEDVPAIPDLIGELACGPGCLMQQIIDGASCERVKAAIDRAAASLGQTELYDPVELFICVKPIVDAIPTAAPTAAPSGEPSGMPSAAPSAGPTPPPSAFPTPAPTGGPSPSPSAAPSGAPTGQPSAGPSQAPTGTPSAQPTGQPSAGPSQAPTGTPSAQPTGQPTGAPSGKPSAGPSQAPSGAPSSGPSAAPSGSPSAGPSQAPSGKPSAAPSNAPSGKPSPSPSATPTQSPSTAPWVFQQAFLCCDSDGIYGVRLTDENCESYQVTDPDTFAPEQTQAEACKAACEDQLAQEGGGELPGFTSIGGVELANFGEVCPCKCYDADGCVEGSQDMFGDFPTSLLFKTEPPVGDCLE